MQKFKAYIAEYQNKSINKKSHVNMQPKLKEEKVGDDCSCCDNKIDENGKCGCGPDCAHCGGSHDVSEAGCSSSLNASSKYADKKKKLKEAELDETSLYDKIKAARANPSPDKPVRGRGSKNRNPKIRDPRKALDKEDDRIQAKIKKGLKKEESDLAEILREYALSENMSADQFAALTEEEINEIIGKAIGGAFKIGAKAAVGAGRLAKKAVMNKQGSIRGTKAARQDKEGDRAEKQAKKAEKERARRDRIKAAQERMKQARSDLSQAKAKPKPKPAQG